MIIDVRCPRCNGTVKGKKWDDVVIARSVKSYAGINICRNCGAHIQLTETKDDIGGYHYNAMSEETAHAKA